MKHLVCLLSLLLLGACAPDRPHHPIPKTEKRSGMSTQSEVHLMDADAFDMDTVTALIRDQTLTDNEALQKRINDPASGINNVDIDKDGKVDTIVVKEGRDGKDITLDFLAIPSSKEKIEEAQTIAFLRFSFNQQTNNVQVSGGYPEYVSGGGYYNHQMPYQRSAGMNMVETYFMMRMIDRALSPSYVAPVAYYQPAMYGSRAVAPSSQLATTRTTYRTTTKVAPIAKVQTKPEGFKPTEHANKTATSFKTKGYGKPTPVNTVTGGKGTTTPYKANTQPAQKASGWGGTKTTPTPSKKASSSGWGGSSSSPRKSSSSGWGGSSGSRKKSSGWGGSSRRSGRRR